MAALSVAFLWQSTDLRSKLAAQAERINELTTSAELARAESADLRVAVARLRESNRLASFRIALLDSLLAGAPKAIAVSVWDNDRQDGVFIVRNLKPLPSDKDYQLWIVDPKYPSASRRGCLPGRCQGQRAPGLPRETADPDGEPVRRYDRAEGRSGGAQHQSHGAGGKLAARAPVMGRESGAVGAA